MAVQSVVEKRIERFRNVIDEFYAFENDYPESKYMAEARKIFERSEQIVKKKKLNLIEEELF